MRASDIVARTRALVTKAPTQKDDLEINQAISEVIALTRSEVSKNGIQLQTQLAEDLPVIQGVRVQLSTGYAELDDERHRGDEPNERRASRITGQHPD